MSEEKNYLVVGLGNPGPEYAYTRHNIGFRILENWLLNLSLTDNSPVDKLKFSQKHQAKLGIIKLDNRKIIVAEPQTFMNNSGFTVASLQKYYHIPPKNILVIQDELDLPLGQIKISRSAGPAGHKGVKSIIQQLGSNDFSRLRLGIAPKEKQKIKQKDFVLSKFSPAEEKIIDQILPLSNEIITYFIKHGFSATANKFNNFNNLTKGKNLEK